MLGVSSLNVSQGVIDNVPLCALFAAASSQAQGMHEQNLGVECSCVPLVCRAHRFLGGAHQLVVLLVTLVLLQPSTQMSQVPVLVYTFTHQ